MILIADSGSTKTDWCVILNGTPIKRIGTKGLNPFFQSEEEIQQELTHSLLPQLPEGTINSVYFYGALPVFWEQVPTPVSMMEKKLSTTSPL